MNEQFIDIIKKYAVEGVEISPEANLFSDLGISSLGMFSLVCDLENAFEVKINIMELLNVKTVDTLYKKFVK